jgi:bla regulator protein blaR1
MRTQAGMCPPRERVHDMKVNAFAGKIYFNRKPRSSAAGLVALASSFVFGLANLQLKAQATEGETPSENSNSTPAWQIAAGGHTSFEVASIHLAEPGASWRSNIGFFDDSPTPPGGDIKATVSLPAYIEFAYKIILMPEQEQTMVSHLPKWVGTQAFVIEAKTPTTDATKDQMRLMMQSLLADRFKLVVHFETQEQPALALVLATEGKTGPRLRPHAEGLACDAKWTAPADRTASSVPPGGFMPTCGDVAAISGPNHTSIVGGRNVSLHFIAANLGTIPAVADFGRPVVDQTGLAGTYDFSLNWLPDRGGNSSGATEPPDAQGPPFEEALKDQLGLKLKTTKAPIQTLVIDHVEQLSPN